MRSFPRGEEAKNPPLPCFSRPLCQYIIGSTGDKLLKQGGIDVQVVSLPQSHLKNPMHSGTAGNYLRKWSKKPALWSRAVVAMIDVAKKMEVDGNNQGAEQQFRFGKHEENVKKTCTEIARHVRQRYDNSFDDERAFAQQLKTIEQRVEMRLHGRKKRSVEMAMMDSAIAEEEKKKPRLEAETDPLDRCGREVGIKFYQAQPRREKARW
jgi:hypothetical protein